MGENNGRIDVLKDTMLFVTNCVLGNKIKESTPKEEILKINIITQNPNYLDLIYKLENHEMFLGRISFPIECVGYDNIDIIHVLSANVYDKFGEFPQIPSSGRSLGHREARSPPSFPCKHPRESRPPKAPRSGYTGRGRRRTTA